MDFNLNRTVCRLIPIMGSFAVYSNSRRLDVSFWTYTPNFRNVLDVFGPNYFLQIAHLMVGICLITLTFADLSPMLIHWPISADWTMCLPMNNHGTAATMALAYHSTLKHLAHIHSQPDTPRKDQVKPQSAIKPRSNDKIHLKDPLAPPTGISETRTDLSFSSLPLLPASEGVSDPSRLINITDTDDLPIFVRHRNHYQGILTSPGKDEPEPVSHLTSA